jgi:hypothetical protein
MLLLVFPGLPFLFGPYVQSSLCALSYGIRATSYSHSSLYSLVSYFMLLNLKAFLRSGLLAPSHRITLPIPCRNLIYVPSVLWLWRPCTHPCVQECLFPDVTGYESVTVIYPSKCILNYTSRFAACSDNGIVFCWLCIKLLKIISQN